MPPRPSRCSIRYLFSTVRGTDGIACIAVPSDGQIVVSDSSQRPHAGHSIIGLGIAATSLVVASGSRRACVSARRRRRATSKPSPICVAMLESSCAILGAVGLLGSALAEHDHREQRAIRRVGRRIVPLRHRHEQRSARAMKPVLLVGREPQRWRSRILHENLERFVRPAEHRRQSSVEGQRLGAAVEDDDRRQPFVLDAADQDGDHLRVQRFVDLVHDHVRQIGRIGLEPDPVRERQEDLLRVVFLAEEPEVQPVPRPLAVPARRDRGADEHRIQGRARRGEVADRFAPVLDQRGHQRERRQRGDHGDGLVGQRVAEAAAQHEARDPARGPHRLRRRARTPEAVSASAGRSAAPVGSVALTAPARPRRWGRRP